MRTKFVDREWIFSPEGIDLAKYDIPAKFDVHCRWILNCIYYHAAVHSLEDDEYVRLHSRLLEQVLGTKKTVQTAKKLLTDAKLIEIDESYQQDKYSKGYRLAPPLHSWKFTRWAMPNKPFVKHVEKFCEYIESPKKDYSPLEMYLFEWAEKARWSAEFDEVFAIVKESKPRSISQVNLIDSGYPLHYKRSPYGRWYGTYTGLVRELRECLQINGEKLIEIDLVGSQAWLAYCVLKTAARELLNNQLNTKNNAKNNSINPNSISILYYMSPFLSQELVLSEEDFSSIQAELDQYAEDYRSSQFYERLMSHTKFTDRQQFKAKFYHSLYGILPSRLKLIANRYPALANFIGRIKQTIGAATFAQLMQGIEADIVIDKTCGRLMIERPDMPVLTCHDSILVPEKDVEYVKAVLLESAATMILPPLLKTH